MITAQEAKDSAFDGLVLDMDGVIVDTPALHRRVWSEFVDTAPWPEVRERRPGVVGRRSKDVLAELLGNRLDEEEIDAIVSTLHQRFLELAAETDTVFPAMRTLLRSLAWQVPLAIGTSAPRHVVQCLLGDLLDCVDVAITSDECDAGKPDPEVYLRARGALGLAGGRVLVIEDTAIGVRAGVAAGCEVWAIAQDSAAASTCYIAGATVVARNPSVIASLVRARLLQKVHS